MQQFIKYFDIIKSHDLDKITEHSLRPALYELLETIAKELNPKIKIVHEHKREGKFGAPDFKVFETDNIIGYIENKKIDEALDKILKSDQIKKYKELSNNLLLTNYLDWIWLKNGEIQQRETLCFMSDFDNKNSKLDISKAKAIKDLINNYFSTAPQGISEPKLLAHSLATRAKILKDFLFDELEIQENSETRQKLKGLYHTFKDFIFNDLTISEFADAFAQTLTYGLFLAKLNADTQNVNLYNVNKYIPTSFQLIKELVDFLKELDNEEYKNTRWIVEEILTVMNTLDLRAINEKLSYNKFSIPNSQFLINKDPYVYFYEDFLAAYDQKLRKSKGVYYTPPPVVNFIVRAINQILVAKFNIKVGLADDKRVTVLDFATGTGTFLVEILQQIFDTIQNSAKRELIVKEHILKNIYGFEYLIAPYTIAHLKLSQFLRDNNYKLTDKERFQVFLTNTLEPIDPQMKIPLLPALTQESKDAQEVKDKPILVITGNPPYSISSANKSNEILKLLKDYKTGLNEQKINLDDDYIKFIRFAHKKIELSTEGIIAVITNNSYLDGATHRKMREKIYHDFDIIYILNLHGNSLKKEGDENVFDIRVGVAISIFVKTKNPLQEKQVYYFSTKENEIIKREDKYSYLLNNNIDDLNWKKLIPQSPNFWFVHKDLDFELEYDTFWSVKDIFRIINSGVKTDRDDLFVDMSKDILTERIKNLFTLRYDEQFEKEYNVRNSSSYNLIERIRKNKFNENSIKEINYRLFDKRFIYYEIGITSRPAETVMQHFIEKKNLGFLFSRQVVGETWQHAFVTDSITECTSLSGKTREMTYVIPLHLNNKTKLYDKSEFEKVNNYFLKIQQMVEDLKNEIGEPKNDYEKKILEEAQTNLEEAQTNLEFAKKIFSSKNSKLQLFEDTNDWIPNFKPEFQEFIKHQFNTQMIPDRIFHYIYAILHSPTYRSKYAEFLKTDFPKIPFTADIQLFTQLAELGENLKNAHLFEAEILEKISINKTTGAFKGQGNYTIEKIQFAENKLYINNGQYFDNVSENSYNFQIGGYQVLSKYLKDSKELVLTLKDIEKIENIIRVLNFTVEQMNTIDILFNNLKL